MKSRLRRVAALSALVAVIAALSAFASSAGAASQPLLPFRCFAQIDVQHVVFGPDSFFLPSTVQGRRALGRTAARRS